MNTVYTHNTLGPVQIMTVISVFAVYFRWICNKTRTFFVDADTRLDFLWVRTSPLWWSAAFQTEKLEGLVLLSNCLWLLSDICLACTLGKAPGVCLRHWPVAYSTV